MHPISIEKFAEMTVKSNKHMNKKELVKALPLQRQTQADFYDRL